MHDSYSDGPHWANKFALSGTETAIMFYIPRAWSHATSLSHSVLPGSSLRFQRQPGSGRIYPRGYYPGTDYAQ